MKESLKMKKKFDVKNFILVLLKYLIRLVMVTGICSVIIMLIVHFSHFEVTKTFL